MDKAIFTSIAKYNKELKLDEHRRVYAQLSEAYRKVGLVDDAIRIGQRGLEIFPSYLACREALGKALYKRGDIEQAAEQLEPVARIVKDNLVVKKLLGKIYIAQEQLEDARHQLEMVSARDTIDFEARSLLISLRQRIAGEEQLVEIDEQSASVAEPSGEPELPVVDLDQVDVFEHQEYVKATDQALGDLDHVEGHLDQIAQRMAQDEVLDPRLKLEKIERRIETAAEARANQVEIKAAAHLAQIHMELSLLDEAIITSRKLIQDDPDNDEIRQMLARFEELLVAKERECERLENLDDLTDAFQQA
ncbi:MAG: tetratricopeptide repeat protein [Candidatus Alcyoniella australis]|nr:tetratricopeptide repeat protein [Candidatus Alcyoniella australis]